MPMGFLLPFLGRGRDVEGPDLRKQQRMLLQKGAGSARLGAGVYTGLGRFIGPSKPKTQSGGMSTWRRGASGGGS
jgi:hypothetical protein